MKTRCPAARYALRLYKLTYDSACLYTSTAVLLLTVDKVTRLGRIFSRMNKTVGH